MDLNLRGRIALVTGSSDGLGKAIAKALAQEGANIIINGRNEKLVLDMRNELAANHNTKTYSCVADCTDDNSIKSALERIFPDRLDHLDILVNNVGNIEKKAPLFELEDEDWLRQFELSFMSMIRFSRASFEWLKKSGHGRIINISSLAATQPGFNAPYAHYVAAKAAMESVAKIMANDFGKYNITVNTICPSTLYGGGWGKNVKRKAEKDGISEKEAEEAMLAKERSRSPLLRIGRLEDVANYVAFLASDQAEFITGQVHYVDGGIRRER